MASILHRIYEIDIMKKNVSLYRVLFIAAFFAALISAKDCKATDKIMVSEKDINIQKDSKYYNPLAASFKWDFTLSNFDSKQEDIVANVIIYDQNNKQLWCSILRAGLQGDNGSLYIFITEALQEGSPRITMCLVGKENQTGSIGLPITFGGSNSLKIEAINHTKTTYDTVVKFLSSGVWDKKPVNGSSGWATMLMSSGIETENPISNLNIIICVKFNKIEKTKQNEGKL
jgi:hypothetical protein